MVKTRPFWHDKIFFMTFYYKTVQLTGIFCHLKSKQMGPVFKWLKQDGCRLVLDHLKSGPFCLDFEFASLDRFGMNKKNFKTLLSIKWSRLVDHLKPGI
jgi:hypothetical protein